MVRVDPAVIAHFFATGDVPALHRMSLEVTSVTGLFERGSLAHWAPCEMLVLWLDYGRRGGLI
jgi:hypothetical protein